MCKNGACSWNACDAVPGPFISKRQAWFAVLTWSPQTADVTPINCTSGQNGAERTQEDRLHNCSVKRSTEMGAGEFWKERWGGGLGWWWWWKMKWVLLYSAHNYPFQECSRLRGYTPQNHAGRSLPRIELGSPAYQRQHSTLAIRLNLREARRKDMMILVV
jgi:hypothetical protein